MSDDTNTKTPTFPALRRWQVLRFKPAIISEQNPPELEVVEVTAHILQFAGNDGRVLAFLDYVLDPVSGPTTRMHRVIPDYQDVQEVNTVPTSLIQ